MRGRRLKEEGLGYQSTLTQYCFKNEDLGICASCKREAYCRYAKLGIPISKCVDYEPKKCERGGERE